jgi:hypothetical protein
MAVEGLAHAKVVQPAQQSAASIALMCLIKHFILAI